MQDLLHDLLPMGAMERRVQGQHLIEGSAQRVDVTAMVDQLRLSRRLFGTHVAQCPDQFAGLGQCTPRFAPVDRPRRPSRRAGSWGRCHARWRTTDSAEPRKRPPMAAERGPFPLTAAGRQSDHPPRWGKTAPGAKKNQPLPIIPCGVPLTESVRAEQGIGGESQSIRRVGGNGSKAIPLRPCGASFFGNWPGIFPGWTVLAPVSRLASFLDRMSHPIPSRDTRYFPNRVWRSGRCVVPPSRRVNPAPNW